MLCSQLQTECPNKGLWRKCMHTALTFRPAAQLLAFGAVSVCMWHVCVFAAELTQLWPWHSLCWILLQVECRNYIRTLHRMNDTTIYVCGTNAFSPTCDYLVSIHQSVESVQRKCFNPSLASTSLCFCIFKGWGTFFFFPTNPLKSERWDLLTLKNKVDLVAEILNTVKVSIRLIHAEIHTALI